MKQVSYINSLVLITSFQGDLLHTLFKYVGIFLLSYKHKKIYMSSILRNAPLVFMHSHIY